MKRILVLLTAPAMLMVAVCTAGAAPLPFGIAGTYSCGFDASGYTAPSTNQSVDVGGIFTLRIGAGTVTQSIATLSVSDGGAGPATCTYSSGSGPVEVIPNSNFNTATLSYQPANANSSLCPPGDASLTFTPVANGLKFVYVNSSGFVGNGTCGIAGVPPLSVFGCNYTTKTDLGTGSGASVAFITPALDDMPGPQQRSAGATGIEAYPNLLCPVSGTGPATYPLPGQPNQGQWQLTLKPTPNCPPSPFGAVSFITSKDTIFITAPGISSASCAAPTAGVLTVTPGSLNFGGQKVKTPSPIRTIVVANTGFRPVAVGKITIAGQADFTQQNNCGALNIGGSCTISVTFTPTTKGARSADIQIPSDSTTPLVQVHLTGMGK